MKIGMILLLAIILIIFGLKIVKSIQEFNNMVHQYLIEINKIFLIPKVFSSGILRHSSTLTRGKLFRIKVFLTENEFKYLDNKLNSNDKSLGKLYTLLFVFLIFCMVVLSVFDK